MASIRAGTFGYWDKVSVLAKWASRLEKPELVPFPCGTPVVKGSNASIMPLHVSCGGKQVLISCHNEPQREEGACKNMGA
jgi:hypothetical protein